MSILWSCSLLGAKRAPHSLKLFSVVGSLGLCLLLRGPSFLGSTERASLSHSVLLGILGNMGGLLMGGSFPHSPESASDSHILLSLGVVGHLGGGMFLLARKVEGAFRDLGSGLVGYLGGHSTGLGLDL